MSESLFNRASKNFQQYLKDFQENGVVRLLPRSRLDESGWQELNRTLVQYGVQMVAAQKDGVSYMKFSKLSKRQVMPTNTVLADKDLGAKLKRYTGLDWEHKTAQSSGLGYEHYRIKIDNLSQSQVQKMLDVLDQNAIYDANAVHTNKGQFLIVRAPDPVLDSVLDYYGTVSFNGVPGYVYVRPDMGGGMAHGYAERIMQQGQHYAVALNKDGRSGADHIVVAMRKTDAEKIGAKYQNDILTLPLDNAKAMQRLKNIIGQPIAHINGNPVMITGMSDFGMYHGRPIVLVSVGDKKLPFYISSGSAGKTDVPTGKWEFFGGITDTNWFRKGDLEDILKHYNSPELKQIADALDAKIGDLRDTMDVLKTIGRQYLGGQNVVASMVNAPEISPEHVNQSVFNPENEGIFPLDLRDIKKYLQGLQRTPSRDAVPEFNQGTKSLKSKILARFSSMFQKNQSKE